MGCSFTLSRGKQEHGLGEGLSERAFVSHTDATLNAVNRCPRNDIFHLLASSLPSVHRLCKETPQQFAGTMLEHERARHVSVKDGASSSFSGLDVSRHFFFIVLKTAGERKMCEFASAGP